MLGTYFGGMLVIFIAFIGLVVAGVMGFSALLEQDNIKNHLSDTIEIYDPKSTDEQVKVLTKSWDEAQKYVRKNLPFHPSYNERN